MVKEGGIEKISVSLPKEILKILDDFCKKNHGLKRSTGIVEAIKKLKEGNNE